MLKQNRNSLMVALLSSILFGGSGCTNTNEAQPVNESISVETMSNISSIAIDNVWSGHRIKPYLLTRGDHQFVAYFDANRQMTVAYRFGTGTWRYYKVDSWLGWDSHNYVTMELDSQGHLHVMGNMHADPLEYFRTTEPYNVRSLQRMPLLVDSSIEQSMTYPIFKLNKQGELIVKYRDGGSGNGNEIYNIYDTKSQSWARLHENIFLDGEGKMNGYFEGPILGPDGFFHLVWVWRNTPNAATNHDLSYAKSEDLVNWFDSNNQPLNLPITLNTAEVIADVPPFGGIINNNNKIGFDQQGNVLVTYHRYDEIGDTQLYIARKNGQKWQSTQISDWKGFRWDFGGGGSLGKFAVEPFNPIVLNDTTIGVKVRKNDDLMMFVLDKHSLKTIKVEPTVLYPNEIVAKTLHSNRQLFQDSTIKLENHVFEGVGQASDPNKKYYLSWQSQPANRDRAHSFITQPSVLLLHEVKQ
ncbi:BNR repeat-containing protein [Pseudomonadota bacterium]